MDGLRDLADVREKYGSVARALEQFDHILASLANASAEIEQLKAQNTQLRDDIDELRRDGRRVAELYDLVFEQVRSDARKAHD
jgi:cell division protein FtsB